MITHSNLVFNPDKELSIDLIKETLQRSLITELTENKNYIDMNEFWKWAKLIGFNVKQKRKQYVVDKNDIKKKYLSQNKQKLLANTEYEICVEAWTKSYLKNKNYMKITLMTVLFILI
jgi:sugar diacid utilization regulator